MGPTGPLATGGDFYNVFVLGLYPVSFDPNAPNPCDPTDATTNTSTTSEASVATPTATSWPGSAYQSTADVFQPNLYPVGGGFVIGYFLKDISTAILSIPTFDMSGNDTQTFQTLLEKSLMGTMQPEYKGFSSTYSKIRVVIACWPLINSSMFVRPFSPRSWFNA